MARNSRTKAICDRCGLEFRLNSLRKQVENRRTTNLLVCRYCLDEDHPQWRAARIAFGDPTPIPDIRPDPSDIIANSYHGWNPVGGLGLTLHTFAPYDHDMPDNRVNVVGDMVALEIDGYVLTEDGGYIFLESQ